jgi:serine/threonine protein kinase
MNTCQECGSEIAAVEAFCPYCGIKIERAEEPAPVPDESFESTIVITPAQVESMKQSEADLNALPVVDEIAAVEVEQIESSEPDIFTPKTTESHNTSLTMEEIPTPSILASGYARSTDPDVSFEGLAPARAETPTIQPTEETEKIDTVEMPAVEDESEGVEAPEPENFEETLPPVEASLTEISAVEIAEKFTPIDPEVEPLPEVFTPETEPAKSFEPEPESVDVPAPSSDETPQISVADDLTVDYVEAEAATPEIPETIAETPVEGILKPSDELDEPVIPPSIFDSVRIVEGEIPPFSPGAENVDTVIPSRDLLASENVQDQNASAEKTSSQPSGDVRGVTGSSLGLVDTDGRRSAKLKPLPEGTILNGRYEIVRKIGGGGMGAVYLASDNNLGGVLRAVKEMVQAHIEEEQQDKAINDFKRESMILSTLDHPSIPTIYDYFYDGSEGRFYLVMKYISGGDLAAKLRSAPDGKIDELTATEWAIQIADVLNYLHNQPTTIVYRDLKPSNVMLDGNSGRVMLIDFGIARSITQKEEKGVTAVGTMGYAPPELFSGNVEPRSDIYSLGSTIFHLLTGADPQSNPLLIFDFQKNPRPRQINSRLSDQIERILMRMVEYNSDSRYSSAAELKAVLEDHLVNVRSGNLSFGVTEAPVSVSLANQSVFCGFCGQRIVATDLFCAFCGAKQPLAQQGVHSEIYHKAQMTARLVIEGTSELSAPVYALQKDDNLIGRRDPMSNIFPEVDLSKYDPQTKISRRHAKIWRDGTAFMLEDLGSSNGTVIEGATANLFRLPAHQPYKLTSGDRIKIGDTRLHFVVS